MELRLHKSCEFLKAKIGDIPPAIGIIPGSGWGEFHDVLSSKTVVDYSEIPDFPRATYHKGCFTFGKVCGIPVVCAGRLHYYEGFTPEETLMPVRLLHLMGVKTLLLTNAAGGINKDFAPGSLMVLEDHISSFMPSVLRGRNLDSFGPRFPDMSHVYSFRVKDAIFRAGKKCGIKLHSGIYLQTPGPQFETPAEIRMMQKFGADAVGMSTATEAVAARHCGMEVGAISCISNPAAGLSEAELSAEDVENTVRAVIPQMMNLLKNTIVELTEESQG